MHHLAQDDSSDDDSDFDLNPVGAEPSRRRRPSAFVSDMAIDEDGDNDPEDVATALNDDGFEANDSTLGDLR